MDINWFEILQELRRQRWEYSVNWTTYQWELYLQLEEFVRMAALYELEGD